MCYFYPNCLHWNSSFVFLPTHTALWYLLIVYSHQLFFQESQPEGGVQVDSQLHRNNFILEQGQIHKHSYLTTRQSLNDMEGNKSVDMDVGICFLTWQLTCLPRHFISAFLWQTIVFSGKTNFVITCHSVTLYQVYILSFSLVYYLILDRLAFHKLFEVATQPLFYFCCTTSSCTS